MLPPKFLLQHVQQQQGGSLTPNLNLQLHCAHHALSHISIPSPPPPALAATADADEDDDDADADADAAPERGAPAARGGLKTRGGGAH